MTLCGKKHYGAKHSSTVSKIRWPSRAKSKVPTFHMSAAMFFIIYKNIDQTRCRRIICVFCRSFTVSETVIFSKVAICSAQMKLLWIILKMQFFQSNIEFLKPWSRNHLISFDSVLSAWRAYKWCTYAEENIFTEVKWKKMKNDKSHSQNSKNQMFPKRGECFAPHLSLLVKDKYPKC